MNIDKVMALMPTIGHETQAKIRTALEQLVVSSREEAFCEAADAISGLYSTKPQGLAKRVEALEDGVRGLLPSFVRGRLEECGGIGIGMTHEQRIRALERANENTGEGAACRSADIMDGRERTPTKARDASDSGSAPGEINPKLATGQSSVGAVPSPASPASVPEWVPSDDEVARAMQLAPMTSLWFRRDLEAWDDLAPGFQDDLRAMARVAIDAVASRAPRPASCSSCDDAWGIIANAHGGDWSKATDEWRSAATRWRDAWMNGDRAPRPSPLSVEELARKMLHAAQGDKNHWDDANEEYREEWRRAARAALSALPAPDAPKPASEAQGEPLSCPHCAKPLPPYSLIRERGAQGEPSERIFKFLDALEKRLDVDDDDAWMLSRSDLDYLRACLASRAPSIEDVVDALLRVTSYKSSYETGASGLVYRADVEHVMRALFDRRSK